MAAKPTLLFMGRIFEDRYGGVREMAESLLRAAAPLAEREGRQIEVLVPREGLCPVESEAIREVVLPLFAGNRMLWDHIAVPRYANRQHNAVLYNIKLILPEFLRIPGFTTVHDLMYFPQPGKYHWREYLWTDSLYMRLFFTRTVRRARLVHCVSECTAQDARELFPEADPEKFQVALEGVHESRFRPREWSDVDCDEWERLKVAGVREPFVFHSGSLARRKNFSVLATAFERFHRRHPQYQLVTTARKAPVAGDPRLKRAINRIPLGAFVRLGGVSERGLELLYQRAAFFVFPSLYEGFGLPPLEAQAAGCPVICSDAASLPEVVPQGALMFDPKSPKELLAQMERIIEPGVRTEYRRQGFENARSFTWEKTAKQLLQMADEAAS